MNRLVILCLSVVTVLGAIVALAGSAQAAPANAPGAVTLTANCDPGGSVEVLINFNFHSRSSWEPAFTPGTNSVFIPTAFGAFVGTFTAPNGDVFPINQPAATKASPSNGAPLINCSYHLDVSDPRFGHIVGDGTVTGYKTPVHS